MRFYVKKRRAPSIIIVSLIDILAILLIFFIVTTTFKKDEPKQMKINLPDAKTAEQAPAEKDQPLVLAIKSEQEITLDGKPVSLDQLAASLTAARQAAPDRPIAMQADRDAPFGVVVKAMDALKAAGVRNIPTFTQPSAGAGK